MNKFTKLVSSILLLLQITNGFQLSTLNGRVIKNSVGAKREAFLSPYVSSYKSISIEPLSMSSGDAEGSDPNEIITARIKVKGDVGGYYRTCVLNEAGKFRRLTGTMSDPDDSKTAEIYVEGKRKMIEGFVRWVKRGNVGLNQFTEVADVEYSNEPSGMYENFYCKTH